MNVIDGVVGANLFGASVEAKKYFARAGVVEGFEKLLFSYEEALEDGFDEYVCFSSKGEYEGHWKRICDKLEREV